TSTARNPGAARGLTLITTTINELLSWETFSTTISGADWLACDRFRLVSSGEMMTRAPGRKFVPCRVSCRCWPPWDTSPGPALVSLGSVAGGGGGGGGGGAPARIVNERGLEVSPVAALNTVTEATPGLARSEAAMAAVSCVPLIKLVGRALPFHR